MSRVLGMIWNYCWQKTEPSERTTGVIHIDPLWKISHLGYLGGFIGSPMKFVSGLNFWRKCTLLPQHNSGFVLLRETQLSTMESFFDQFYLEFFLHCPVLLAFGWSFTCQNTIYDILASLLVGHPFGGTKKTIWLANACFFLGVYGEKGIEGFFMTLSFLIVLWSSFISWLRLLLFHGVNKAPFLSF